MKHFLRALVFMCAYWAGLDDYEVTEGAALYRPLKWLYGDDKTPFSEN